MKINRLETHDRLLEFQKQADIISQGCADCIKSRPQEFGTVPFYIFAHKRDIGTDERISMYNNDLYDSLYDAFYQRKFSAIADVPTARMIWEPRLTKPTPQENSMCFKHYPIEDYIKVIWIIPDKALWKEFEKGKLAESNVVCESIYNFQHNPQKLAAVEDGDLSDERIDEIYRQISLNAQRKRGFSGVL